MKIKTHKESSGQRSCLSTFPRAANDQTIASHRERYGEKQTGHACPGTSPEQIRKRTAQRTYEPDTGNFVKFLVYKGIEYP